MPGNERWLSDANTILRYLLGEDDVSTRNAGIFWEEVREGIRSAILLEGVLLECVYVLQRFYKVPREKISENLRALLAYKGLLHPDIELLDESLALYGKVNLDFIDCLLAVHEKRGHGKAFTFDELLNKLLKRS